MGIKSYGQRITAALCLLACLATASQFRADDPPPISTTASISVLLAATAAIRFVAVEASAVPATCSLGYLCTLSLASISSSAR